VREKRSESKAERRSRKSDTTDYNTERERMNKVRGKIWRAERYVMTIKRTEVD
jgi:hypothetical protein